MNDLIKRLRNAENQSGDEFLDELEAGLLHEAADRIEELEKDVNGLMTLLAREKAEVDQEHVQHMLNVKRLKREVERLRAALEFYRNPEHGADGGQKASKALAAVQETDDA